MSKLQNKKKTFTLKAKDPVEIGKGSIVKVNTSIGISSKTDIYNEFKKAEVLCSLPYRPDIISDLSILPVENPLYRFLLKNFDGAVGIVPYYSIYSDVNGLDDKQVLETIQMLLEEGVSFMPLHLTANRFLYDIAIKSKRNIACTSRGGYCILKDALINKRCDNVLTDNITTILKLFKKHNAVISIGSVFRPATIWDAMDDIQRKEIEMQRKFISLCHKEGVNVILEGLGHASLNGINKYLKAVSSIKVPLMPLGPIPSDELIGFDHVGNALGILAMSNSPWLSIINSITRREHTGGIPTIEETIESLKSARAAAHIINCRRSQDYLKNMEKAGIKRCNEKNCVVSGGLFEENINVKCNRCGRECPFSEK